MEREWLTRFRELQDRILVSPSDVSCSVDIIRISARDLSTSICVSYSFGEGGCKQERFEYKTWGDNPSEEQWNEYVDKINGII